MRTPKIASILILILLGIGVSLILLRNKSSHKSAETPKIFIESDTQKSAEITKPSVEETAQSEHTNADEEHTELHDTVTQKVQVSEGKLQNTPKNATSQSTDTVLQKYPLWHELRADWNALQSYKDKNSLEYHKALEAYHRKFKRFVVEREADAAAESERRIEAHTKLYEAIEELSTTPVENQERRAELNKIIDDYYASRREGSQ